LYSKESSEYLRAASSASFCSPEMSASAAQNALISSCCSRPPQSLPVGIAVTSTLPTDNGSSNTHCRALLTIATPYSCITYKTDLNDLLRSDALIKVDNLVEKAVNLVEESTNSEIEGCEVVGVVEKHDQLASYLKATPNKVMFPWIAEEEPLQTSSLLPGSFNPIHKGHVEMCGSDGGWYELSIGNVDKGFIKAEEVKERCEAIADLGGRVMVSNAALFSDKLRGWKILREDADVEFRVGDDTYVRIIDPKYYDNSVENMEAAMQKLNNDGATFLVYPRTGGGEGLQPEPRPGVSYAKEWEKIDVSSSEIRAGTKKAF